MFDLVIDSKLRVRGFTRLQVIMEAMWCPE